MSAPSGQPGLEVIDAPLLRVPFESLKRSAKERKSLVDEASEALAGLSASDASAPSATQLQQLDQLLGRLHGIKRKLIEAGKSEANDAARCKSRLAHLAAAGAPPPPGKPGAIAWSRRRLDRLIADHLLRDGLHASAAALAAAAGLQPLLDTHLFSQAQRVAVALRAHDAAPALDWCAEHRARLRKLKSPLEFRLRLQQFVQLISREQPLDALAHARTHLAPWAASGHLPELQRALGALAFGPRTSHPRYTPLYDASAWEALVALFETDLLRLHCLPQQSLLTVHLQAGLAALKTPQAQAAGASKEDPLHLPDFQALAQDLPCAKHTHSKLVCAVTRQMMDETNPPMVLPNGLVYSRAAVEAIAARNQGRVVCPRTGSVYSQDELRRAYIV